MENNTREFETGATKDTDNGKLDYEGFFSPIVLHKIAQYMYKHRIQSDGTYRDSDNWQKGMPKDVHMKSTIRHLIDAWCIHDGFIVYKERTKDGEITHVFKEETTTKNPGWIRVTIEDALCGMIFGGMGYIYELSTTEKENECDCGGKCKCEDIEFEHPSIDFTLPSHYSIIEKD